MTAVVAEPAVTASVERLVAWLELGETDGLFAPDAFADLTFPRWRIQVQGAAEMHALKSQLKAAGHNTNVGDEGGFAPNIGSAHEALEFIVKAGESAGFKTGKDFVLGLDAASSEFFKGGKYVMAGEGKTVDPAGMVEYLAGLVGKFPIVTIEDGCARTTSTAGSC